MVEDYIQAHDCSMRNRAQLEKSTLCGCFYCKRMNFQMSGLSVSGRRARSSVHTSMMSGAVRTRPLPGLSNSWLPIPPVTNGSSGAMHVFVARWLLWGTARTLVSRISPQKFSSCTKPKHHAPKTRPTSPGRFHLFTGRVASGWLSPLLSSILGTPG